MITRGLLINCCVTWLVCWRKFNSEWSAKFRNGYVDCVIVVVSSLLGRRNGHRKPCGLAGLVLFRLELFFVNFLNVFYKIAKFKCKSSICSKCTYSDNDASLLRYFRILGGPLKTLNANFSHLLSILQKNDRMLGFKQDI